MKQAKKMAVVAAVVAVMSVIVGCASPEKHYAEGVREPLARLDRWVVGPVERHDLLLGGGQGAALRFCLSVVGMCNGDARAVLSRLAEVSHAVTDEGFELKAAFQALDPPAELRAAHEQVLACIEFQMTKAQAIASYIENNVIPTEDLGNDPCQMLGPARRQIVAFLGD